MSKVEERQKQLKEIIETRKHITIKELCEMLDVSHLTIRRDLKVLEKQHVVSIAYGGNIFSNDTFSQYATRETENLELKKEIAKRAVNYIDENEYIYISGGSTCIELAKAISEVKPNMNINVITSCAGVAKIISQMMFANVTLIGGSYIDENETMVSSFTLDIIKTLNFNKAFLCSHALTENNGAMFIDIMLAKLQGLIATKASQVVLMLDATKLGKTSMATGFTTEDIDILITNETAKTNDELQKISKHNILVDYV